MTIKRIINGKMTEITLDSHELYRAWAEEEHIFDVENVRNFLEDNAGLSVPQFTDDQIDRMARRSAEYMDDNDTVSEILWDCVSDAVEYVMQEDGLSSKTIKYHWRDIELKAVKFVCGNETVVQDGILVHDTTDEFADGDTIYGNGWRIGYVRDSCDLETLLTSSEGTTNFTVDSDGIYHVEAGI